MRNAQGPFTLELEGYVQNGLDFLLAEIKFADEITSAQIGLHGVAPSCEVKGRERPLNDERGGKLIDAVVERLLQIRQMVAAHELTCLGLAGKQVGPADPSVLWSER